MCRNGYFRNIVTTYLFMTLLKAHDSLQVKWIVKIFCRKSFQFTSSLQFTCTWSGPKFLRQQYIHRGFLSCTFFTFFAMMRGKNVKIKHSTQPKKPIVNFTVCRTRTAATCCCLMLDGSYNLGIQIRKMKIVFNSYCTWCWVTFEKLMMKIYDFFYSAKSLSQPV